MTISEMPLDAALVALKANSKLFGLSPVADSAIETAIAVLEYVADLEPTLTVAREAYDVMTINGVNPDVAKLITLTALLANGVELPGLEDEALATCNDVLHTEAA